VRAGPCPTANPVRHPRHGRRHRDLGHVPLAQGPGHHPAVARITLEALLFGGVGYLLWQAGAPTIGTALAAVWVLHRVVLALTAGTPNVLETGGTGR
jgi:hypothetical protein